MLLLAVLVLLLLAAGSGPAGAAARPEVWLPSAVDAPRGEKGGIVSAGVSCSNWQVQPRAKWVLKNLQTGRRAVWRWRGEGPGYYFPRVSVGRYRSTTTAWCNGRKKSDTRTLVIEQKTAAGTVSRSEWRQIRVGTSRSRVRQIVGNGGRDPYRYGGHSQRTYDMMPFWRWSVIRYRDGRVTDKWWNVGHD